MKIAFVGGTGPAGIGLAARLARAGRPVLIGSRSPERAADAAERVRALVPEGEIASGANDEVIAAADVVFLTIAHDAQRAVVGDLAHGLAGKVVVSMANPLRVEKGTATYVPQPEGSLAEGVQRGAPGARVVSAFHEIRVSRFAKLDERIDSDSVVCGDDEDAKRLVMDLVRDVGIRPVDGGPLANARYVEAFVAVLITINFRYKAGVSYRITGLPENPVG